MSIPKSLSKNSSSSNDGSYEHEHQLATDQIKKLDHYLFNDRSVSTSTLIARVLSRDFIDPTFLTMVRNEFGILTFHGSVDSSAENSDTTDDDDDEDDDDEDDDEDNDDDDFNDDRSCNCYEYCDCYDSDESAMDDSMYDLFDGVLYDD
ncbi:unnamed protein product [Adineta steineri]|uniref:Uncharacterized protein n=1 Tax=Adineta steineri TaxID=433720 RepID=A0A815MR63_9BILA|nr:unnamed protein product [Adineta steineri]CAF3864188.1 unnamed protein product [Adineta steineri]